MRQIGIGLAACLATLSLAAASTHIEKNFTLRPGGSFTLSTSVGRLHLVGGSGDSVQLVVDSDGDALASDLKFEVKEQPGNLQVIAKVPARIGLFNWGPRYKNVRWELRVPRETNVTLDTSGGSIEASNLKGSFSASTSGGGISVDQVEGVVKVDTSGGGISLSKIVGDVSAETSGGGIDLADIQGNAVADTSGGGISAEKISGDIKAETSGGSIDIVEAGGRVDASTSGGSVAVTFASGNAKGGTLESSGGGVVATIDPRVALSLDASSSGGRVHSELPVEVIGTASRDELRGTINGGGQPLHMSSSGGPVKLLKRG